MTINEAKEIDIVIYLFRLGIHPSKINGDQYWYYSPLRNEHTTSFKVNRSLNLWFDFGEGKGRTIIDLGIRLHNCTVKELLERLESVAANKSFSSGQHLKSHQTASHRKSVIEILSTHPICSPPLVRYLASRKISVPIADKYLCEVRYQNGHNTYYALGFKNDRGGYELRSSVFKGSSSPKGITYIDNNVSQIAVFEGVCDFISYLCYVSKKCFLNESFLILNSLAFFEKQLTFLQAYNSVDLYLDNDPAGDKMTILALSLDNRKFSTTGGYLKAIRT